MTFNEIKWKTAVPPAGQVALAMLKDNSIHAVVTNEPILVRRDSSSPAPSVELVTMTLLSEGVKIRIAPGTLFYAVN